MFVAPGDNRYGPLVSREGRPKFDDGKTALRECRRHGLTGFRLFGQGGAGPRWRCTRCVGEAVNRRHRKLRAILVEEAGGCCAVCGYSRSIINLHFHHVDPSTKALSMNVSMGKALATYRAEAKKCVLVCANCHGEIETGLIPSPPAGTKYREPIER